MATVSVFDQDMIERSLASENLNFEKIDQNNYHLIIAYDVESGCDIRVILSIEGQQNEIFAVRAYTDRDIPKTQWADIIMLCNKWNKTSRWPKAYLNVDAPDTIGKIVLEEQIDLSKGIHDGLLIYETELYARQAILFAAIRSTSLSRRFGSHIFAALYIYGELLINYVSMVMPITGDF